MSAQPEGVKSSETPSTSTNSVSSIGFQLSSANFHGPVNSYVNPTFVNAESGSGQHKLKVSPNRVWFNLLDPIESFHGRETVLQQIHDNIQKKCVTVLSQVKIIGGFGGVGKTQVARKYIQKYNTFYRNIVWIDAETSMSIQNCFRSLAERELNIEIVNSNGKSKDMEWILNEIYKQLCSQVTLLIFDNAEKLKNQHQNENGGQELHNCGIHQFFPRPQPAPLKNPFIIVTTRNLLDWGSIASQLIQLEVFSADESISFILDQLGLERNEKNEKAALTLTNVLGGLPLALQQAVAFIRYENELRYSGKLLSIDNYIEKFNNESIKMTLLNYPPIDSAVTVYKTWNVTLSQIKKSDDGHTAIKLIEILALLNPDNVPIDLLSKLAGFEGLDEDDNRKFEKGLHLLRKYSMIGVYRAGSFITVHRQVQHVILESMKIDKKVMSYIATLVKLCDDILNSVEQSNESYPSILNNLLVLTNKYHLISPTKEQLEFKVKLAKAFCHMGSHNQALEMLQEMDINTSLNNHAATNSTGIMSEERNGWLIYLIRTGIALSLEGLGRLEDAFKCHQELYGFAKKVFGSDHYATLATKYNLANVLGALERNEESLKIFEKIHKDCQKISDQEVQLRVEEEVYSISATVTQANVFRIKGKYEKALEMYEDEFDLRREVLGRDHPETLHIEMMVGVMLHSLHRYDEALARFRQVHTNRRNVFGDQHPLTLQVQNNIAITLMRQERFDEALQVYQQVHDMRVKILGTDHPDSVETLSCIAGVMLQQEKLEDVLNICKKIHESRERKLGVEHPQTLDTLTDMVDVFRIQGRLEEASNLEEQVWEICKRIFTLENPQTFDSSVSLDKSMPSPSVYLDTMNKYKAVYNINKDILTSSENNEDEDTVQLFQLDKQVKSAAGLEAKCKYEEAYKLYKEVHQIRKIIWGAEHDLSLSTREMMAKLLTAQGNLDKAFKVFNEVYEIRNKICGPEHDHSLSTQTRMADVLVRKWNVEEAVKIYQEIYEVCRQSLEPQHPGLLLIGIIIIALQIGQGDCDESAEMQEKVIRMKDISLGPAQLESVATLRWIAEHLVKQEKFQNALRVYEIVYELRVKALGEDHPDSLVVYDEVAQILDRQGHYYLALQMYQDVYEIRKKTLSLENLDSLTEENYKISLLVQEGQFEMALHEYNQIIKSRSELLGGAHPGCLGASIEAANTLVNMGAYQKARNEFYFYLFIAERILGKRHPLSHIARWSEAAVLVYQMEYQEALEKYEVALKIREVDLDPEEFESDPYCLSIKGNFASILAYQGKYKESLEMFQHILRICDNVHKSLHCSFSLSTQENIAVIHHHQGEHEVALKMYKEMHRHRKKMFGKKHPETVSTQGRIAFLLYDQGKFEESLKCFKSLYKILDSIKHPDTLMAKTMIGDIFQCQGKYDESLKIQQAICENSETFFGSDGTNFFKAQLDLAITLECLGKYEEAMEIYKCYSAHLERASKGVHPSEGLK